MALLTIIVVSSNTTVIAAKLLPAGESEWAYSPSTWNDTAKTKSNCYQFAMLKASSAKDKFKLQPGYTSEQTFTELTEKSYTLIT
ncbi:hypothetical protein [Candidatus Galacturonibacter soehngenii]|uniref:Uncharacterized protein n=1 Tax=Candidatus Galacturonatibacter soehngenii TaxID=2307010 RepID=A0A7V7QM40_9FIRM|nr:hypothetical protein [Candidatus Galacturonibacter soehngenii]KAB1438691.1 hypothetical protein F7O84_14295 [Candidatus Galacturonibacter soehngenii]